MSWVEKNRHNFSGDPVTELGRYLRASGIDRALHYLSGPYGVRRFLVFFELKGRSVRVTNLESVSLQMGGGPPAVDLRNEKMKFLEAALWRLCTNMAAGPAWTSGCLGFVRDLDNNHSIAPFFDEDQNLAELQLLPIPSEAHPLETPEYKKLLGSYEAQIMPVWNRTSAVSPEWDFWDLSNQELRLIFGQYDTPREVWRRRAQPLGTFSISQKLWEWRVNEPLFDDDVYCSKDFLSSWDSCMELSLLTTARLGANWLFVGEVEEGELSLLAAVWES